MDRYDYYGITEDDIKFISSKEFLDEFVEYLVEGFENDDNIQHEIKNEILKGGDGYVDVYNGYEYDEYSHEYYDDSGVEFDSSGLADYICDAFYDDGIESILETDNVRWSMDYTFDGSFYHKESDNFINACTSYFISYLIPSFIKMYEQQIKESFYDSIERTINFYENEIIDNALSSDYWD